MKQSRLPWHVSGCLGNASCVYLQLLIMITAITQVTIRFLNLPSCCQSALNTVRVRRQHQLTSLCVCVCACSHWCGRHRCRNHSSDTNNRSVPDATILLPVSFGQGVVRVKQQRQFDKSQCWYCFPAVGSRLGCFNAAVALCQSPD